MDVLVFKVIFFVLILILWFYLFDCCFYLVGIGGFKGVVWEVVGNLWEYKFVFCIDVKGYYVSINYDIFFGMFIEYIKDDIVLDLLW